MKNTMLRKSFEIFVKIADWTVKHSTPGYLAGFHLQMDALLLLQIMDDRKQVVGPPNTEKHKLCIIGFSSQ